MAPPHPPELPGVRVVRAADRFVTRRPGIVSRHCFSFGEHYDAGNLGFGRLVALNDEVLAPGAGFPDHAHAGVDLVTWVVQGRLEHTDSAGRVGLTGPGVVQVLATGAGVTHGERNAGVGVCRFVQSWLTADDDARPGYAQIDVSSALRGELVSPVLDRGGSRMYAGRLPAGAAAELPDEDLLHVFVVRGSLSFHGAELDQGDSVRLSIPACGVESGSRGAELLVWGMDAS